jgi:hypothetical protein
MTSFRRFLFTITIICTADLGEVKWSVGYELASALFGATLKTKNWLVSSKLDFYNVHSDWLVNIMFKGSVLSADSIRFHRYTSISGKTLIFLFGWFICNGLLLLSFHWSIQSYRSSCLSMDVLSWHATIYIYIYWGTRYHSWLRHYATRREGSILEEVDFYNWLNPSNRTKTLGSTQPLTEMSTRNLSGG